MSWFIFTTCVILWNCTHFRNPTDEQLGHVDIFFSNYYHLQSVYFEYPYVGMMSLSIFNCVCQDPYLGMIMSKFCFDWWTPFKK